MDLEREKSGLQALERDIGSYMFKERQREGEILSVSS